MGTIGGRERFYGYSTDEMVPQKIECPTDRIVVSFSRENTHDLDYIIRVLDEEKSDEMVFLRRIGIATMQIVFGDTFHFQQEIGWVMWRSEYVEFLHDLIRAIR